MKPVLAIGLGNPLMGDDGIGCAVAERLAVDPGLPNWVEVICGGSDLLRHAGRIDGRRGVVVIDAIQDSSAPGSVLALDNACFRLEDVQEHVHHLSAVQAVRLLNLVTRVPVTLLAITVQSVSVGSGLSAVMEAKMAAIRDRVLEELAKYSA